MAVDPEEDDPYSIPSQEVEEALSIVEERREKKSKGNPSWDYTDGEIPTALDGAIGAEIMDYILDQDRRYISSKEIAEDLEIDVSSKQVGQRMHLIGNTLGLEKDEVSQFSSRTNTWNLETLKSSNLDELYEEVSDEISAPL